MGKSYKEILSELEKAVQELGQKGISIQSLNNAIEELKAHSDNISKIEENIDAVRAEVIDPIRGELEQNQKAGKFSIYGFYVGAFGLIVSAISLMYTTFYPPDSTDGTRTIIERVIGQESNESTQQSLTEIIYHVNGLVGEFTPSKGQLLIKQRNRDTLLTKDSTFLEIEAYIPSESKVGDRFYPFVSLKFL